MMVPERFGLFLAALSLTAPVHGANDDLEARVRLLEQRLSSHALVEMLQRLDQLQREVQSLHGQVEALQNTVEQLQQARQAANDGYPPKLEGRGREPEPSAPVQASAPAAASPETVQQAYRQAFNQLQAGHYNAAIDAFSEFLQHYPEVPLAANAYYWLGEAYYVKRDFKAASEAFRQVVAQFPKSPKVADALLKLGYAAYEQGRWQDARHHLEEVVQRFPKTRAAHLAVERLERMKREGRI